MMKGWLVTRVPAWPGLTDEQARRWGEMLDNLTDVLPPETVAVVVDGAYGYAAMVADGLADTLHALGRPCARLTDATPLADEDAWRTDRTRRTVAVADGPRWRAHPPTARWDVAAPRWPPATAVPCVPTNPSPRPHSATSATVPAGSSPPTTIHHTGSWPSPPASDAVRAGHHPWVRPDVPAPIRAHRRAYPAARGRAAG
jgi:hypothetical protein